MSVPYAMHAITDKSLTKPVEESSIWFSRREQKFRHSQTDTSCCGYKIYISDSDGETQIETGQASDEDVIRMKVAGNERMCIVLDDMAKNTASLGRN